MRAGNRHSSEGTCTMIIRALMISVAPSMPPLPVPPISAIYECYLSVPPTSASSSVQPISAHHCSLISAHQ
ncbi:unnamed protein product [Staurois parvus]|uniref:Uncharacterized protein n=1 Tax=Staurois parvus TaxID=386267 RepID=A0ABN9B5F4_9NEOB|nr:unnamed protein product [Staurois parvus]